MDARLGRILMVEDDPRDVELTLTALEEYNLANEVVVTHDGAEALDYLNCRAEFSTRSSENPAVILLDLKLPKVDGLEVLTTIKANADLARLPVVVLTTSAADADLARAYGNHANSYLVKPMDLSLFRKLMDDLSLYWLVWNQHPN